jgi:hypothetical protein
MKRVIMLAVLLAGAFALAATGLADPGDKGKKQGKNKFAFVVVSPVNGSCGQPWATSTSNRTYAVKDNGDGTFTLRRQDRGTFVTTGPVSPGKCDPTGKHGTVVMAGYHGKFTGYLVGTVKASSFNPKATCVAACFTDVFVKTFFSPDAQFSCSTNSTDCKFNFNYTSKAKQATTGLPKLKYRHWQDKGKGAGTLMKEQFIGDIANS